MDSTLLSAAVAGESVTDSRRIFHTIPDIIDV